MLGANGSGAVICPGIRLLKNVSPMYKTMSSVLSFLAQPVTRSFVVTQDTNESEYGAYYFSEATINAWAESNAEDLTKVSKGLYIITGNFYSTLHNLSSDGSFEAKRSLLDMGSQIIIGNTIESRLVVLRKVKNIQNPEFTGIGGEVGYIVVESNYRSSSAPPPAYSRFNVNVARA